MWNNISSIYFWCKLICFYLTTIIYTWSNLLMQFFGPVTWHHQRRPFRPRLGLQNKKSPPGVVRRNLLQRSSQSSVCIERRERERERPDLIEIIDPALIILILHFYTHVCHMPILPLSSTKLCVDVWYFLWLNLTGFINIEGFLRPRSLSGDQSFPMSEISLGGQIWPHLG
jgi:hypothetical protein